jgi:multicomponent Na+:H+ antiporter subunit F
MTTACLAAALVLALMIVLAMIRLAIGPSAPDRVVALDAINTQMVAIMILLSVAFEQGVFIDVAIVYALLSFVGTLYLAKFLTRSRVP